MKKKIVIFFLFVTVSVFGQDVPSIMWVLDDYISLYKSDVNASYYPSVVANEIKEKNISTTITDMVQNDVNMKNVFFRVHIDNIDTTMYMMFLTRWELSRGKYKGFNVKYSQGTEDVVHFHEYNKVPYEVWDFTVKNKKIEYFQENGSREYDFNVHIEVKKLVTVYCLNIEIYPIRSFSPDEWDAMFRTYGRTFAN